MNFVRRMTAGRGIVRRSERTTLSRSASTISALPSITRRSALRIGTMVRGSNDAFRAKQPTTTQNLRKLSCESRATRALLHFKRRRSGEGTTSPLLPDDEQARRKVRVLPEGTRRQNTLQGAL